MDVGDFDPDFLKDLARHRIFQALTLLNETSKNRVLTRRPIALPTQNQAIAAIMDKHDDGGVEAREMLGAAVRIAAFPHMAGIAADGRATADAAELVPRVPLDCRTRIDQQCAFLMRQ